MNEKQGDRDAGENGASEAADAGHEQASKEPDASEAREPQPPPVRTRRSGSLALVLSLLALALAGWLFYERISTLEEASVEIPAAHELAAVEARLDELAGQLAAERDERQQLLAVRAGLADDLDRLSGQLGGQISALERESEQLRSDLERRSTQWSEDVEGLARQLGEAIDAWSDRGDQEQQAERDLQRQIAMLEAAAMLRIGQARAELAGDLSGAKLAYRRADEHLRRVDDVRLDRIRRALAVELEALESVRSPDLGQSLARLDRLARESRRWPTALAGAPGVTEPEREDEDPPADWRERLSGAARGLVRVQARDDLGRTQEQFEAARELVQLRLVAAQLALARRDVDGLDLQLAAAIELLDEWFDPTSEAVRQARGDLNELVELRLEQDVPELGAALNGLQTLMGGS